MRSRTVTVIVLGLALLAVAPGVVDAAAKKDAWYAQHYFLMQDYERKAYKALTPNGKLEFQKIYWEFRSPAIREEFDRRLAYIEPTFKNENSAQPWNTDRGRIYLLHGRPAGIDQRQNDFWTGQYTPPGAQAGISSDRSGEDIQGKRSRSGPTPSNVRSSTTGSSSSRPASGSRSRSLPRPAAISRAWSGGAGSRLGGRATRTPIRPGWRSSRPSSSPGAPGTPSSSD